MKILKAIWENKFTIFCFITGYFVGFILFKFWFVFYENEVLTNTLLKKELIDIYNQECGE